jgi:hypothetical protein
MSRHQSVSASRTQFAFLHGRRTSKVWNDGFRGVMQKTLLLEDSPEGFDQKDEKTYKNGNHDGQEYDTASYPDNCLCALCPFRVP